MESMNQMQMMEMMKKMQDEITRLNSLVSTLQSDSLRSEKQSFVEKKEASIPTTTLDVKKTREIEHIKTENKVQSEIVFIEKPIDKKTKPKVSLPISTPLPPVTKVIEELKPMVKKLASEATPSGRSGFAAESASLQREITEEKRLIKEVEKTPIKLEEKTSIRKSKKQLKRARNKKNRKNRKTVAPQPSVPIVKTRKQKKQERKKKNKKLRKEGFTIQAFDGKFVKPTKLDKYGRQFYVDKDGVIYFMRKKDKKIVQYKERPVVSVPDQPGYNTSFKTKYITSYKTYTGVLKFILKNPPILDEDGIEFILNSIQSTFDEIPKLYPDFKVERGVCNVKVEVKSDDEIKIDDIQFETLKFGDLDYPNINRDTAAAFFREAMEKHAASDKWLQIVEEEGVILYILPAARGGCYDKEGDNNSYKTIDLKNGMRLHNPRSNNNNCFFACFKEQIREKMGIKKITPNVCNKIRSKYGLQNNCKIDTLSAEKIAREEWGIEINIINKEGDHFTSPRDTTYTLVLIDEHYLLFEGMKETCPYCGESSLYNHDPIACANRTTFNSNRKDNTKRYPLTKKLRSAEWQYTKNEHEFILHFDIESYKLKDKGGKSQANCVGFAYYDLNKEIKYEVITGEDCIRQFLLRLRDDDLRHIRWVNAYNGSKFDNYFLIKEEEKLTSLGAIDPLETSSGIIKASVGYCNIMKEDGEVFVSSKQLVDIRRHLIGSLKANLIAFGCEVKKGEFNHELNGEWDSLSENIKSDLLTYLKADVMGLMELSNKIHFTFSEKYNTSWVHFLSTSHAAYSIWINSLKEEYIKNDKLLLPTTLQYKLIKKSIYGGRCEVHRKKFESKDTPMFEIVKKYTEDRYKTNLSVQQLNEIKDYCRDLDVTSLYPYCMMFDYPTGIPFSTGKDEYHANLLGIYSVRFKANKRMMTSPLPRKENGKLLWDVQDGEGVYTSVDIENARRFGYEFEFIEGLVWPERAPLFKDYINEQYKEKEADKTKGAKYQLAKLMMNSLYGKTIQKPRIEKTFYITKESDWYEIYPKYHIDTIDSKSFDNCWVVKCTSKNEQDIEKAISKPAQLGTFVLAYSRQVMMNYIYQLNPLQNKSEDFFYTDTDSLQCHISQANNIDMSQKGLGFLSDDLKGRNPKIFSARWVSPKLYILRYLTIEKEGDEDVVMLREHRVGKGVKKTDGIIPLNKEQYNTMTEGGVVKLEPQEKFYRKSYKMLNKKEIERGTENFTVSIRLEDKPKTLNRIPFCGREFDSEGNSVPIGYDENDKLVQPEPNIIFE